MAEKIEIRLFDGFVILKDGKQILQNLSNTRKTKLFVTYLLTNRDRAISHQELFELLWSGEEYANPATALRTLLYRFRSTIDSAGAEALSGAIISRRGTYQWNRNLGITIDILDFTTLSEIGLDESNDVSKRREALEGAIDLYKGSLLPDFCSEPWLISKAAAYRDKYIEVVLALIQLYKEDKRYAAIVGLCDRAQELAGSSELIELEKEMAKFLTANNGQMTKSSLVDYYNEVRELSKELQNEVDNIQQDLEDETIEQKAYLCDYRIFKEIYRLQRRMQSRSKATIFLGVIDAKPEDRDDSDPGQFISEKSFNSIIECCQRQLRCGDAICKRDDSKIAVLFPAESYEDAMGVLERLKNAVMERMGDEQIVIVYRVKPLKNAKE